MKKQILVIASVLATGAAVLGIACSDTPMDMPKNDSGTADNNVPIDSGGGMDVNNQDVFMPDAANACDKGIVFDNKGRVPGWPNVPQP
jgi:hypothetical protein